MLTSAINAAMERGRDAAGLRAHCMLAHADPRTDMPAGSPEWMHRARGDSPTRQEREDERAGLLWYPA